MRGFRDRDVLILFDGIPIASALEGKIDLNEISTEAVTEIRVIKSAPSVIYGPNGMGGVVDVVPDSSPILGPAGPKGLYLNCGWGTGGFKAIPAGGTLLAHMLATGDHHPISKPFDLSRFTTGRLIDEAAGSGIAH